MTVVSHHHPLVLRMEAELLPLFQAALPSLASPQVLASVFAFSTGSQGAFLEYRFGISCLLDAVPDHQPDELALLVTVAGLNGEASVAAEVRWGQPSGHCEAQAALTEASMPALHAALPALLATLRQALERGRPADDARPA